MCKHCPLHPLCGFSKYPFLSVPLGLANTTQMFSTNLSSPGHIHESGSSGVPFGMQEKPPPPPPICTVALTWAEAKGLGCGILRAPLGILFLTMEPWGKWVLRSPRLASKTRVAFGKFSGSQPPRMPIWLHGCIQD